MNWPPSNNGRVRSVFLSRGDDVRDFHRVGAFVDVSRVAYLTQIHGNRIVALDHESHGVEQADAIVTTTADLACVIQVADCQACAIYAPDVHALAVVHAGWRGLAQNILTKVVESLTASLRADPGQMYVWASPSLCKKCSEFTDPKSELPLHLHPCIEDRFADLQAAADHQFISAGIPLDRITRNPDCTKCNPNLYWSYRAKNYDASLPHRPGDMLHRNLLVATLA